MKHCVHASKPLGPFVVLCTNREARFYFGERAHIRNCAICGHCRPDPTSAITIPALVAPPFPEKELRLPGLGDRVEKILKPIAVALGSDCLDEHHNLKPDSGCAKRRDALNALTLRRSNEVLP